MRFTAGSSHGLIPEGDIVSGRPLPRNNKVPGTFFRLVCVTCSVL